MRRQIKQDDPLTVAPAAAASVGEALICGAGILGTLAILLLASRAALAEPAGPAPFDDRPVLAVANVEALRVPPALVSMDTLLEIPGLSLLRSEAQIADESIAAAVERGTNSDLKPLSAFRKRRSDLFRAERPVEIGEQEMLIRLRLRAKARKAMSVELHF